MFLLFLRYRIQDNIICRKYPQLVAEIHATTPHNFKIGRRTLVQFLSLKGDTMVFGALMLLRHARRALLPAPRLWQAGSNNENEFPLPACE
jgi:hypothetical protein